MEKQLEALQDKVAEEEDDEIPLSTQELAKETLSILEIMSRNAKKHPKFLRTQLSRVDWGSVRDLKSSFTGGWGAQRGCGGGMADAAAAASSGFIGDLDLSASDDRYGPGSRYDASTMNRIVDVNDLHEKGSDISNVSDLGDSDQRRRRRTCLVAGTIGTILMGSIAIGAMILTGNYNAQQSGPTTANIASLQVGTDLPSQQQRFLDIAQHILSACSESRLNEDMTDCQILCHDRLCCFEEEEEDVMGSSEDSDDCREDENMNCAVYAGCEMLVLGSSSIDEDSMHRVNWG